MAQEQRGGQQGRGVEGVTAVIGSEVRLIAVDCGKSCALCKALMKQKR